MVVNKRTIFAALILTVLIITIPFISKWNKSGKPSTQNTVQDTTASTQPTYKNITPQQLKQMLENKDFLLIDVHIPEQPHIPGTDAFIPYNQIDKIIQYIGTDKDRKVVLYCRSGAMSSYVAKELAKRGYKNVYNLEGGMNAWKKLVD